MFTATSQISVALNKNQLKPSCENIQKVSIQCLQKMCLAQIFSFLLPFYLTLVSSIKLQYLCECYNCIKAKRLMGNRTFKKINIFYELPIFLLIREYRYRFFVLIHQITTKWTTVKSKDTPFTLITDHILQLWAFCIKTYLSEKSRAFVRFSFSL